MIWNGIFYEFNNLCIFLDTDAKYKSKKLLQSILKCVCKTRNIPYEKVSSDEAVLIHIRDYSDFATLEHHISGEVEYYTIKGKNFSISYPSEEFKHVVIHIM